MTTKPTTPTTPTTLTTEQQSEVDQITAICADPARLAAMIVNETLSSQILSIPYLAAILESAIQVADSAPEPEPAPSILTALADLQPATPAKPAPTDSYRAPSLAIRCVIYPADTVAKVTARRDSKRRPIPGTPGKRVSSLEYAVEEYCKTSGKIYQRIVYGPHQAAMLVRAGIPEFQRAELAK